MRRRLPLALLTPALAGLAALGAAGPAAAHVEPEVSEVPAGSTATVEFTVEHGCDGSPTVKLEFQVPDGVTDAAPVEKAGWTGAVVDGVVTYTGGSLPDDQEDAFGIRFTAPAAEGTVLRFPMIQTCETGQLDWIQLEDEAERPAPAVELVAADPNAATTVAPTIPLTTTSTTAPPSTTEAAAEASTTSAADEATTDPAPAADPDGDDGGNVAPWLAGGAIGLVIGGIAAARLSRAKRADGSGAGGTGPDGPAAP